MAINRTDQQNLNYGRTRYQRQRDREEAIAEGIILHKENITVDKNAQTDMGTSPSFIVLYNG